MNSFPPSRRFSRFGRPFTPSLTIVVLLLAGTVPAFADDNWIGQSGSDSNWSDSANWSSNTPDNNYGTLYFNDTNNGKTTITNDITASFAENALKWYDTSSWTINTTSTTGVINLYDNGGTQSEIENFSTGSVTINTAITFAANNSRTGSNSHPFGQIDAIGNNSVGGNLTFGATGTLQVGGPGSTVDGIQMFGSATATTTFNDTVNASNATNGGVGDKYFALIGQVTNGVGTGTNVTVGGTFNSGDIYVMNGSTLNLASGGTINTSATSAVRLGGDFGNTGYQDLTKGGTFNLMSGTGGQTFAGIINTVGGNTSGALLIRSQNTSGTNTISGSIYLDSPLNVQATKGGTLALTGTTVDVKSQKLNFAGAGVINVTNGVQSSTGGGTVNYNGSGTLLLNGNSGNTGATNVNSGTLGGLGTVTGPVNVNAGGTIHPGNINANGVTIVGKLSTGALTLDPMSTSVFDLASSTNYSQIASSGAVTLAGTLTINNIGTFNNGDTLDLVNGSSLSGTYSGITNDGVYTFGGQKFEAIYTASDFELVAVPEPATYLAGFLMVGMVGYNGGRRWLGRCGKNVEGTTLA